MAVDRWDIYFQKRRPPENADAISRALASIGQSPNLFWGRSRFSQVPKKFGEKSGQMRTAGCPAPPIQFPNASTLSQKRYLDQFLPGGWRGPPLISVTLISLWNFLSPFFVRVALSEPPVSRIDWIALGIFLRLFFLISFSSCSSE